MTLHPTMPRPVQRPRRSSAARRAAAAVGAMLLATGTACGGSDPAGPPEPPDGAGSLTAVVEGVAWTAELPTVVRANGIISLGGYDDQTGIHLAFFDEGATTYSIPAAVGLNFNYTRLPQAHLWQALGMGTQMGGVGSGTVTVTTLTATRVAGTFSFTAPAAVSSGATGTRTITNGRFDLEF